MHTEQQQQRTAVVCEALSWLKTPYHHMASVKGAGVDCAMILIEVYFNAGVIDQKPMIEAYPPDWMLHRAEERYLSWLAKYGTLTKQPKAGDVAIWKFGRCFSHAAILVENNQIVHANRRAGMVILDDMHNAELIGRDVQYYTFWQQKAAV